MHQMMDREAGDHSVELAQTGKRLVEIMCDHADGRLPGKALAGRFEHGWREVDGYTLHVRAFLPDQAQQASVARAQIQDSAYGVRYEFEQSGLAILTMGDRVGAFEIVAGMFVRGPEIDGFGGHEGKVYGNV